MYLLQVFLFLVEFVVNNLIKYFLLTIFCGTAYAGDTKVMKLSERNSGYELNKNDWVNFFDCWKSQSDKELGKNDIFFLSFSEEKDSFGRKILFGKREGLKLPRSFVDFHRAYVEYGGLYRMKGVNDGVGVFSPEEIQPLSEYMNELITVKKEWPIESKDFEYYKYGIEQDDSSGRTSYLGNAIVIGQYGFEDNELIVIYPDSKTEDGEFETALFAHASEARAPSFVEMMRQLSFLYLRRPDSIPIYSQEIIKGTCADKLPLKSVWWK